MVKHFVRFMREEEGLMVALIAGAIVVAVTLLGTNLSTRFTTTAMTIAS